MKTIDFRTKTILNKTPESGVDPKDNKWIVALDIGYSAVKGISQNYTYCFPAYANKIPSERLNLKEGSEYEDMEEGAIRYRDDKGTWYVGNLAYMEIKDADIIDNEDELFSRNRYASDAFHVITAVGLAIGCQSNSFGSPAGKDIFVQTGLPPKYLEGGDKADLIDSIAGHYDFELKIERKPWQRFVFDIQPENIDVMPQPLGSFIIASLNKNGYVNKEQSKKLLSSNSIVFDPGFGTVDTYLVVNGSVKSKNTLNNLGMKEVFNRTKKDIKEQFGKEISISELQTRLEDGRVRKVHKKDMSAEYFDFSELLFKNCEEVCLEVIEKMKSLYNYFSTTDYIIATGGTYEAWKDTFNKAFERMDGLEIVPANRNQPDLSNVFSNVRGYYYYRLRKR